MVDPTVGGVFKETPSYQTEQKEDQSVDIAGFSIVNHPNKCNEQRNDFQKNEPWIFGGEPLEKSWMGGGHVVSWVIHVLAYWVGSNRF